MINLILSEGTFKTIFENDTESEDKRLIEEILDLTDILKDSDKYLTASREKFRFKHHVGVLQTRNYRILVLPKIWKEEGQDTNYANRNLIKLFLYAFSNPRFSDPEIDITTERSNLDLFELIIRLYATRLEDQLSMGVYREYNRIAEESRYLRGKLNLMKQLNRIDQSKFSINDFRFSVDNDLNRFFVYATEIFTNMTRDTRNAEILSSIQTLLDPKEVSYAMPSSINFNRMNERFQIPYTYAKLVLDRLLPLSGNGKRSMIMLFDMNLVFEAFFARFVARNSDTIFKGMQLEDISVQSSKQNFIYRENGKPVRYTKPDVKISTMDTTFIFDTKYKNLTDPEIIEAEDNDMEEVSQVDSRDLYQMFTYSEIYNSKGTVLVFPGPCNKLSKPYRFTKHSGLLWVCMIHMDLNKDGWEGKLADDFRNFFETVKNTDYLR